MTFLKNISYVVLGAGLGIATVFLARRFLTSSTSNKKSKTNEDKSTKIYVIPYNKDDNKEKERKLEVSSIVVQNPSDEEPLSDETVKTIIDGIALIKDQTKEKSIDPVYSIQYQNSEDPVSVGNTSENSAPVDQILVQNENNEGSKGQEKERSVKTANERKNTSIYLITAAEDNNGGEPEKPSQLVQNRSKEESTSNISTTKNAIVDGIALIRNQTNELLSSQEGEKKSVDKDSTPYQNTAELVSGKNTFDNLPPINQTPVQDLNDVILNSEGNQKTVKKIFVKKYGGENIGVVLQYAQNGDDKQMEDWNVDFKSMKESSAKSNTTNSRFISIPSEVLANEKLNSTIYESFEEKTQYKPFKPPRIRRVSKSDTFERSKFNKNISLISSRKPSAQSTLLETNKKIEVKPLDDIQVLAEESNIQHSSFQSDHFLDSRHNKTAGHRLWRRYGYIFGNLFSWKKRASDRSKLIDSPFSTDNYGNKSHLIDLIEDHGVSLKKYKKLK